MLQEVNSQDLRFCGSSGSRKVTSTTYLDRIAATPARYRCPVNELSTIVGSGPVGPARLEGRAVSLPTGSGLTERAVRRSDFGSVEPA